MIRPDLHQRIVDTVEICYREGGEIYLRAGRGCRPGTAPLHEKFACKVCGQTAIQPEPTLFSFNNPMGACPVCQGFGNTIDFDFDLIIPDPTLSINEGAVDPWTKPQYSWYFDEAFKPKSRGKVRCDKPYSELRADEKEFVRKHVYRFFQEVEKKKYKVHVRVFMSRYRAYTQCPACRGARLRPGSALGASGECNIAQVSAMNIRARAPFFSDAAS